ncbi:putative HD superfamily hydrolase [Desulfosporosinus orientis DSM 765]|uniref:Putative HD superfamily hydrolase n=1 Tax=Desulfosporosinus orientis (strain ATCC 19365 / DSM 765 / NCIMB 8382 / VKM B-1628 / Singapore I) TaxID=768706 RepID=G7WFR6_DESOD|nr:HD domain-containing protein [Desulfosporosinus orientis]AET68939.1 putative HD superfamily hydrolase [Desulfosporosinus orientis DSM 765]
MKWESIKEMLRIFNLLDTLEQQGSERDYPIGWEKVHATSCAQIGRMLAEKKGVEIEQAALACALHDIGRWFTGRQQGHAPNGEEHARQFLADITMEKAVKEQIVQAVINHSKKDEIGSPLEEIVKDADILDCYWYGDVIEKPFHKARLIKLLGDLGIKSEEC